MRRNLPDRTDAHRLTVGCISGEAAAFARRSKHTAKARPVGRVHKDDALGYTVTVSHQNGRTTLYANLGEDVRVKVGDRVNAGDVLGTVGTSAISECALPPHLHFAISVDGVTKDPAKYVRLG